MKGGGTHERESDVEDAEVVLVNKTRENDVLPIENVMNSTLFF